MRAGCHKMSGSFIVRQKSWNAGGDSSGRGELAVGGVRLGGSRAPLPPRGAPDGAATSTATSTLNTAVVSFHPHRKSCGLDCFLHGVDIAIYYSHIAMASTLTQLVFEQDVDDQYMYSVADVHSILFALQTSAVPTQKRQSLISNFPSCMRPGIGFRLAMY